MIRNNKMPESVRLEPQWNVIRKQGGNPELYQRVFTEAVDIDQAQLALKDKPPHDGWEIVHFLGEYAPDRHIYEPDGIDNHEWVVVHEDGTWAHEQPTHVEHAHAILATVGEGYKVVSHWDGSAPFARLLNRLTPRSTG